MSEARLQTNEYLVKKALEFLGTVHPDGTRVLAPFDFVAYMDRRLPQDPQLFEKCIKLLNMSALTCQENPTRAQGSTENVKPLHVITRASGATGASDPIPRMGYLDMVVAPGRWVKKFFVMAKGSFAWYASEQAYGEGEECWEGRIPMSHISKFILAADDLNMDMVTTGSPYPFRYKFRSEVPGLLRIWAESAARKMLIGCERYQYALPTENLVAIHALTDCGPAGLPLDWDVRVCSEFHASVPLHKNFVSPTHPRTVTGDAFERFDAVGNFTVR